MSDLRALLEALAAADPGAWEDLYAGSDAPPSMEVVVEAAHEGHPAARWMALRIHAGPPGQALPAPREALERLLGGEGTPADAWAVFFGPHALPGDETGVAVLQNAALRCLVGDGKLLTARLAGAAALACLAIGDADRASFWFDLDERHDFPFFEVLRPLRSIVKRPEIVRHPSARRAVAARWRTTVAVPGLPHLEVAPDEIAGRRELQQVLEIDAPDAFEWLAEGWLRDGEARAAQLEEHPFVLAIREAVLRGDPSPPDGDPPADLGHWIAFAHARDEQAAARLGSLAMIRAGREPEDWSALVLPDIREDDLPVLAQHLPESLRRGVLAVQGLLPSVPDELREPLVIAAGAAHPRVLWAARQIHEHRGLLADLSTGADSWLAEILAWVDGLHAEGALVCEPDEGFGTLVKTRARDLPPVADLVESALTALVRPIREQVNEAEAAWSAVVSMSEPSARFLGAVALLQDTPDVVFLQAAELVSHAIMTEHAAGLMRFREKLLEEVLQRASSPWQQARARIGLVNTRNFLRLGDPAVHERNLVLLREAADLAWRIGAIALCVDVACLRARMLAAGELLERPGSSPLASSAEVELRKLLELRLEDDHRGDVLVALAVLARHSGPAGDDADLVEVEKLLREAIGLMSPGSQRADAIRELAHAIRVLGRLDEAQALLESLLDGVDGEVSRSDRAYIHADLGRLLALKGEAPPSAEEHMREALRLVAGDRAAEAFFRLQYGWFLYNEERDAEALDQVETVTASNALPTRADRLDLERLRGSILGRLGRREEAEGAFDAAISGARATSWEPVVLLQRADRSGDDEEIESVLTRFFEGAWPSSEATEDQIVRFLEHYGARLSRRVLEAAVSWSSERGRHLTEALMLGALGADASAREVLESLVAASEGEERTRARVLLLAVLPENDVQGRRDHLDALDHDGVDYEALPAPALHDLAEACRLAGWSTRSLFFAQEAFHRRRGTGGREAYSACWLRCLRDHVLLEAPRTSEGLAQRVRDVVRALPHLEVEAAARGAEVVDALLLTGPWVHPSVWEVAGALLDKVPEAATASARAQWDAIRRWRAGELVPAEVWPGHPADVIALGWAAPLLRGEPGAVDDAPLGNPPALVYGCACRPDLADQLLHAALGRIVCARDVDLPAWEAAMCHVVLEGDHGEGVWPRTSSLLEQMSEERSFANLREVVRRARGELRVASGAPVDPPAAFRRAGEAMLSAQRTDDVVERARLKAEAIEAMTVALDGWRGTEREVHALISMGNALRMRPDAEVAHAIDLYAEALELQPEDSWTLGKLHKVWADALRERREPGDLRAAWGHVQTALEHRQSGWLRAETLWAAAQIADLHPDWDATRRAIEASRLMTEAAECAPRHVAELLPFAADRLATWRRARPEDAECTDAVARLRALYPEAHAMLDRADAGMGTRPLGLPVFSADEAERFVRLYQEPDFEVATEAELAVGGVEAALDHLQGAGLPTGEAEVAEVHETLRERSTTEALQARLERLDTEAQGAPLGVAAARAILLAELARRGVVEEGEARSSTVKAREVLLDADADADLVIHLLDRVAAAWSQGNDPADPIQDFALARDLRLEALDLVGAEERAPTDLLVGLGRAYRYAPGVEPAVGLREARRLYELGLARRRSAGDPDGTANALVLLADLELHLSRGNTSSRLIAAERLLREALGLASRPGIRRLALANLAWTLTLLGQRRPPEDATPTLKEALTLFAEAKALPGSPIPSVENNELLCRQALERASAEAGAVIEAWRERVARRRESGSDAERAMAEHNLADCLLRLGGEEQHAEAVALFRSALAVRRNLADLRHRWESSYGLGYALLRDVKAQGHRSRSDCRDAFLEAADAARELGGGEELARAGLGLGHLALAARDEPAAEQAWQILREATTCLLVDRDLAASASRFARELAFSLADRAAAEGLVGRVPEGAVLGPGASSKVLQWLLRADTPYRQEQVARLRLPAATPASLRAHWLDALNAGDALVVDALLEEIRQVESGWLREEDGLGPTLRWLSKAPESRAMAVWPAERGFLVAVVEPSGRASVLLLTADMPAISPEQALARLGVDGSRAQVLEELTGWARAMLTERVLRVLGEAPTRLLWVPHGVLRSVPPSRLFPGTEVAVSASLRLAEPVVDRPRGRAGVVVVADPGQGRNALGGAVEGASRIAEALGSARLVLGVGGRSGEQVLAGATNLGPSPAQVVRELDEAGIAIVIAHGHFAGGDDAWIDLLGPSGGIERLHASDLATQPRVLAGLTVVLLSCETGHTGGAPDRPGGLAGALLTAGAKRIVAPLWEVSLSSALDVGDAVAEAWSCGGSVEAAVAQVARRTGGQGPQLGRRPSAERRAARAWDHAAFVTWVG